MRFTKFFFLLCTLIVGLAIPCEAQLGRYKTMPGTEKINFKVKDVEGQTHKISDFKGKIVLVNFWATWCPPCVAEMPSLHNLAETFPETEFVILAVCKDMKEKDLAKRMFEDKYGKSMTLLFDDTEAGAELLGVKGLPSSYILDRDGYLIGQLTGATVWDHFEVQDLIQAYINGRTPKTYTWWEKVKRSLF